MAALYIAEAQRELNNYIEPLCQSNKEAVLVIYCKQGPKYLQRFLEAKKLEPDRVIKPGEGCRVCLQKNRFLGIFPKPLYYDGLDPKYQIQNAPEYA